MIPSPQDEKDEERCEAGRSCLVEALTGVLTALELHPKAYLQGQRQKQSKEKTEYLPSRGILKGPSKMWTLAWTEVSQGKSWGAEENTQGSVWSDPCAKPWKVGDGKNACVGGFPQDRGGILIAKTFKYSKLHGFEEKLNININIY